MKTYRTQKEFEAEIKDNVFVSNESIDISQFNLNVQAHIEVRGDINAWNINALNINARDINAGNINAGDINAWDINAWDINAWDIKAWNIKAGEVEYYAVAFAYKNIKVKSIKGIRENSRHFVLDGEIIIEDK